MGGAATAWDAASIRNFWRIIFIVAHVRSPQQCWFGMPGEILWRQRLAGRIQEKGLEFGIEIKLGIEAARG